MIADPFDLPRMAQDYTGQQVEACVMHYVSYPVPRLRQRQDIHRQQITMAAKLGHRDAVLTERIKLDIITDAISRQVFGEPQDGCHNIPELRS